MGFCPNKKEDIISKIFKIIGAIILILILIVAIIIGTRAKSDEKIYVNDQYVKSDQLPIMLDNKTFVPVQVIAEGLGAKVKYHEEDKTMIIQKGGTNIRLAIGDEVAWYSDEKKAGPVPLDTPAFIRNDTTYLSLKAISELFNVDAKWDDKKRAVYIKEKSYSDSDRDSDRIDENNAGEEVLERLKKLSIIGEERLYIESRDYEGDLDGEKVEGYFVTVRKDNPNDAALTELVGHYVINKEGTLLLQYDPVEDEFKILERIN